MDTPLEKARGALERAAELSCDRNAGQHQGTINQLLAIASVQAQVAQAEATESILDWLNRNEHNFIDTVGYLSNLSPR